MSKNFRKRALTSFVLLLTLVIIFLNNYLLSFILLVSGIIAVLEFFKMTIIIFKRKKIYQLIINSLFTIYIFSFCVLFFSFSSFAHLKILIFLILLTCIASDIGGYIFGKIFKGVRLTRLSPNKTISGAIGSIVLSCIVILTVTIFLTKEFDVLILIIGIITSISSQIGDLFFSYFKRRSRLNDTGNFLPGHGGILDRIDGILFGLPIGFLTLVMIY